MNTVQLSPRQFQLAAVSRSTLGSLFQAQALGGLIKNSENSSGGACLKNETNQAMGVYQTGVDGLYSLPVGAKIHVFS